MLGILLAFIGSFLGEISASIGKYEIERKKESIYGMSFLHLFSASVAFSLLVIFNPSNFSFSLSSLPTFGARFVFEAFHLYLIIQATVHSDRSTVGFLSILTIPIIFLVDFILGYTLDIYQLVGIGIISLIFVFFFSDHDFSKKGARYSIISAIVAVFSISLYKYNITNFNSVVAEQLLMLILLAITFYILSLVIVKENPIRLLKYPIFSIQSALFGVETILMSFAYLFAPASVIIGAKRALNILWSLFAGHYLFKEKHFLIKIGLATFLIISLVFLGW